VIWKDSGWPTILFLAVLSQVDTPINQSSAIDGASRARQLLLLLLLLHVPCRPEGDHHPAADPASGIA